MRAGAAIHCMVSILTQTCCASCGTFPIPPFNPTVLSENILLTPEKQYKLLLSATVFDY